jgi:hypothetical protein
MADYSRGASLLGLFDDGRTSFFVSNSLVQDHPDQPALSMADRPMAWLCPSRTTQRR